MESFDSLINLEEEIELGLSPQSAFLLSLIPAIITFYILVIRPTRVTEPFGEVSFRKHAFRVGAWVGLTFGIVEVYRKLATEGALTLTFWKGSAFNPTYIPPVLSHIVFGMIVVEAFLTVYRSKLTPREKFIGIGSGLVLTMTLHVLWNTWLPHQKWFWDLWVDFYNSIV